MTEKTGTGRRHTKRMARNVVIMAVTVFGAFAMSALPAAAVEPPAKGKSAIIDRIRDSGTMRVGINVALPWLGQNPQTREFFGPAMELTDRIAKSLGVKVQLSTAASDVIIAGLQANQYDLAMAPLFATPRRMEVVNFVNWTSAGQCYVVLKDNNALNSLADLDNPAITIGTWTGSGSEQAVKAKYAKAKYNSVVMPVGGSNRFEEVIAKRIDAATFDSARANLVAHQFPQVKILPGGVESCLKSPDVPTPIGMAFVKGDPVLQAYLQAIVDEAKPAIDASLAKYSSLEYMLPKN
jgi:ABC-type amino acid transport substrate-binding protein